MTSTKVRVVRLVSESGAICVVTYDAYNMIDTISMDGRLLRCTHPVARKLINCSDEMLRGIAPKTFRFISSRMVEGTA